jgi:hypothetical protein
VDDTIGYMQTQTSDAYGQRGQGLAIDPEGSVATGGPLEAMEGLEPRGAILDHSPPSAGRRRGVGIASTSFRYWASCSS